MSRILRLLIYVVALNTAVQADTLQQLLDNSGIPATGFSADELSAEARGVVQQDENRVILLFGLVNRIDENALAGPRVLVAYEKKSAMLKRNNVPDEETKVCGSGVGDLRIVDEFLLIETSINPSAGCTLVFDDQLKLQKTLYGFHAELVAPGQLILVEDMIHFAPVHPERLQLVDLHKWTDSELYPPKGDLLRRNLAMEHAAKMPSQADCTAHNESCEPDVFDEEVSAFHANGRGRFAFIVNQSASHIVKDEDGQETVAAQAVFYIYQRKGTGWLYCQQALKKAEVESLTRALAGNFDETSRRCVPAKVVYPDLKTQRYNPFIH